MHEMAIAQNICKICEEEWKKHKISQTVSEVVFRAGKLNAVIPDILRFNFDVIKKDYASLKEAELVVEEIPIQVRCKVCGKTSEIEEPLFLCMECGGAVSVETGQEMFVENIRIGED